MGNYSKYSDLELYEIIRQSDKKSREFAFEELYSRYAKGIYAYCYRILGNNLLAEDIFQETFLSFLKAIEKERVMTNVQAFLLRIARNLCLNANRDKNNNLVKLDEFEFGILDKKYENAEITKILVSALDLLKEDYKEALILQIYYDMSYKEISDFLNLPISTIRNRVTRAKQEVRRILAPYFEKEKVNGRKLR